MNMHTGFYSEKKLSIDELSKIIVGLEKDQAALKEQMMVGNRTQQIRYADDDRSGDSKIDHARSAHNRIVKSFHKMNE